MFALSLQTVPLLMLRLLKKHKGSKPQSWSCDWRELQVLVINIEVMRWAFKSDKCRLVSWPSCFPSWVAAGMVLISGHPIILGCKLEFVMGFIGVINRIYAWGPRKGFKNAGPFCYNNYNYTTKKREYFIKIYISIDKILQVIFF